MRLFSVFLAATVLCSTGQILSQTPSADQSPTLRLNSRAVLIDVVVTDRNGNPVTGLSKDAFNVREQGKPQSVAFFEEHRGLSAEQKQTLQVPKMPPDTFSNYSPIVTPPAINVLLIDALNTPMTDQMYLRQSVENYLRSLKPGSRLAIFTLSLRLRFVEGFSDDPSLLATAMGYRNNNPEPAVLMQSGQENTAENTVIGLMSQRVGGGAGIIVSASAATMIQSFEQFLKENHYAQTADREYRTTQALQQLARYLGSFPGRKNLVWMSGGFPLDLFGVTDMRFDDTVRKTVNLLAAARVAVYPVDARGVWTHELHMAEHATEQTVRNPQQFIGPPQDFPATTLDSSSINQGGAGVTTPSGSFAQSISSENASSNTSNAAMDIIAEQTGGRAFYNGNNLVGVLDKITSSSSNFYTLSYTPTDPNMNGAFRKIGIEVHGKYALLYRRGYFATDEGKPGAAQEMQHQAVQQASAGSHPLEPFMDFGLPQSQQILYVERIVPASESAPATPTSADRTGNRYAVDFFVATKDLNLKQDADGAHKGTLHVTLIVYDRYGEISMRRDHRVAVSLTPEAWAIDQKTGLKVHAELNIPRGQYWLRTGIYDPSTHRVGTMEVPLSSVQQISELSPLSVH